ncbi:MAG: gamma-glutamylcyclotransferase family protein [Moraxellaceae bacterium]|nr:gamma-glutamylcyclotransferase family protein [Moraxellaceae bacterium]
MNELIFVYGSLRRGSAHAMAQWLASVADWQGEGRVAGTLYRVSWYPALVIAGEGVAADEEGVQGDVFRLHEASALAQLDAFEGVRGSVADEYRRERLAIRMASGEVQAWVYVWQQSVSGLKPVKGGDWLQSLIFAGPESL